MSQAPPPDSGSLRADAVLFPAAVPPDGASLAAPLRAPELVSIVAPAFNEAQNLSVLHGAVTRALGPQRFELILVDDGSRDATAAEIARLALADARVWGVHLARNFGHQAALLAGLMFARGDVVISLDADMQHPPELLPELIRHWQEGALIVHTQRREAAHLAWPRRWASRTYYRCFSYLSGVPMNPGMADFRLLDRRVVDEVIRMREPRLFLRGALHWMGHRSATVAYDPQPRASGRSKYTWRKMLSLASDGVFAFSTVPLRLGLTLGLLTSALAFAELAFAVAAWALGATVAGWASTIGLMSLLFAVQFLILGVQGQYILRLYEQSVSRPPFLVERVVGREADGAPRSAAAAAELAAEAPLPSGAVRAAGSRLVQPADS